MYLREVKRPTWARLREDGEEAIRDAVVALTQRGTEASVFECSSNADRNLVAVALLASRRRQPFRYISLLDDDVEDMPVAHSLGETPLPDANLLHRDLDLAGGRARLLVERLAMRRVEVADIRVRELQSIARRLMDAGQPLPATSWLIRE